MSQVRPPAFGATGERHFYIDALHKRYGPVAPIGLKETSFASADATPDIIASVSVTVAGAATAARQRQDNKRKKQPQMHEMKSVKTTKSESYGGGGDDSASTGRDTTATSTVVKTFPKAPIYDITRSSIGSMSDEAAHCERLRHVGPMFAPAALLPAVGPVLRAQMATLHAAPEKRRSDLSNMLHWFRLFSLDTTGEFDPFLVHLAIPRLGRLCF